MELTKKSQLMAIFGFIIIVAGFFFPVTMGERPIFIWEFSFLFNANMAIVFGVFAILTFVFAMMRKTNWLLSAAICDLILVLSFVFMLGTWKQSVPSKFYLHFFRAASIGWYLLLAGVILVLIVTLRSLPKKKVAPYLFILPMLLGIGFLTFFPAIFAVYVSFRKWNIMVPKKPFVGFDNYIKAFQDKYFWDSLLISFKYAIVVIPSKMILAYFFALLIYAIPKFKSFFRVVYFLPTVTSVIAVSVIWSWIYHPSFGLANYILEMFRLPTVDWLGEPNIAIFSVAIVSIWKGIGYDVIIFLAGLNAISESVIEASEIDGATRWQKLKYIITPLMRPSLVLIFITSTIGAIQVFSEIYMMTGGNADTKTAVFYIWEYGFTRLNMGYASAMSMIFFGIILIITLIQMRVTKLLKEE